MQIRQLSTDEERFQARLISTLAFHGRMEDPEKARAESGPESDPHWGAFDDDGTLMAHIIDNQHTVWLDGTLVPSGGVGAVSTLPEYRITGAVREIFGALLPAGRESGEVLSTLFPFNHAFYRKFGYETAYWKNQYAFPPAVLRDYRFTGKAVRWKKGDPVAPWTEMYNRFASGYNLALQWDDKRTAEHLEGEWYRDRKFCYLLTEAEQPVAFIIFQDIRHDPAVILEVKQMGWFGRAGFEAMLGFLARFSADYGTIRLFLPREVELFSLIHTPHPYDIEKTASQGFMVRVMNTEKLLRTIRKPAGCRFVIRVADDMIPENSGTWAVTDQLVTPVGESPDLSVSVQALGQMACGASSLAEALLREDTVLHGNREILDRVFVRKPILVEDHY